MLQLVAFELIADCCSKHYTPTHHQPVRMALENQFKSTLKVKGSDPELERLMQENQELKRQLANASHGVASQIAYEELDIQDQIGGGGFSIVYRGLWGGTPVAIKKWFDPQMSDELIQEFREEVMTLQGLRHPNIIQFLGACSKPPKLACVMEHLPHSLHNVLYVSNTTLDKSRIISLAQDIARAFIYLHSRKPAVIHRDVKPANFLLDRAWKVKVCDFGLASNSRTQAGAGTPAYMAPELFENRGYNEKVDVYAFGILLNEMVARQPPFSGSSVPDIQRAVLSGTRPDIPLSCPKQLQELITHCWEQQPSARPSFERILEILKDAARMFGP